MVLIATLRLGKLKGVLEPPHALHPARVLITPLLRV